MAQLFISYSRVDAEFVTLFIRRLGRAFPDLTIWYDKSDHGLIGGDNWWDKILQAIADSDIFIYILSNESVNSLYCQAEFTEARRLQKRIITVQARDRTELTDDLDDIQFIDMKDGVDRSEALASLVAAVNLRLREAPKYRHVRPLWKPATPKPNKESPPTRTADAPEIETLPLEKPNAELETLRLQREGLRWQVILGVATLGVTLLVGLAALLPWLAERDENARATQAALALTPSSTAVPTITPTLPDTPTPTETLDVALIVATLDAQATVDQATLDVQATAAAQLTEYAVGTQSASDQTATATLWTLTPTPNITASIEAFRTQQAQTATQAWIDSWTDTPTPTFTFTPTFAPTPDPLQGALDAARTFSGNNTDWQALYPDGFQRTFDDGVTMVVVPAGSFIIGANPEYDNERNGGTIRFDQPFWIDLTEVTQADFERLGGAKANANAFDGDQRPVENITWFEARDFCALRGGRLPTEAEWEYAARGPSEWTYPWDDDWNANNAAWNRDSSEGTADTASFPAGRSWVGAFDMSGNVREWTSSLYLPYDSQKDREADTGSSVDAPRVMRGGSWINLVTGMRTAYRVRSDSYYWNGSSGFRCARSD